MSRPSGLIKDESLYWVVMLYDSANALVDADSTPTVAVRKNGVSTADVVTITKITGAVWDGLIASHTVSGSFGERVLVSTNTNHEVLVTGSNHVAADVHEFQTDAIDADAIAASAVTEIQTGLVTIGTAFTHTNQAADTMTVTIT